MNVNPAVVRRRTEWKKCTAYRAGAAGERKVSTYPDPCSFLAGEKVSAPRDMWVLWRNKSAAGIWFKKRKREDAVTKQDRKDLLNDILPCQQVVHSSHKLRNFRFYLRQSYLVNRLPFAFFFIIL